MNEDLSRRNDIRINYQFWFFGWRIVIQNINKKNKVFKALIKRIVQFDNNFNNYDLKSIPIVINNFNRLSFLKKQIESLQKRGYHNLYVIDNNSTYEPLIEYYQSSKIKIFFLDDNVGFLSIWKTLVYEYFKDGYYVYTDADIVPIDQCPGDFILYFRKLLDRYPEIDKVGFGLKIDDLPDAYQFKETVQQHESQFWKKKIEDDVYEAMIDTTFALYRPKKKGGYWLKALRTGGNYLALHLPWYVDTSKLSEEDIYYNQTIKTSTHWTELLNGNKRS